MVCAMTACAVAHAASPIEYKSVGAVPAILYDAPSAKGRKLYVAPRGMPVEVVLTYGEWNKVRDANGDLSWIEAKRLSSRRTAVVRAASAKIHASASDGAPLVFTADKGVLLELVEPIAAGWVKVRHRDGQSGYVRAAEIWGE
ncbi:MAG TPA: SH3 domain-containing protein [Noviherbaspirillum sp.]|nr:SH3 domain-containing protein [Noviherbaspirillum sp.]